ncbi:ribose-5-phosphate isomerase RpiA [Panacibacter ginsenosidivorans]|uniref:Ribose-5-phosphate isomerase A n=1 Tax=Panacibacter ginsenosidivorans TaxID=1813871 RepID=A0A5B8V9W6_9BACT|nr:ribose-5-phosphate isomerase RpiA [Panacibacter ginsenosidivorans]QEC67118.1 ribose-5-phosphate isomerase RpiA [Panacibacter ginsenosidivorans]
MSDQNIAKKKAGEYAATLIEPGMTIGIGTGSTVYFFIQALAKKIQEGLIIKGVPTSKQTQELATELNIPLVDLNNVDQLDITVDGADEIDPQLQLIKGGGGALLQEKIVAAASKRMIVIADESKYVQTLGKFPLPVEVIDFGWKHTMKHLQQLGCERIVLRKKDDKIFVSDHGHYILDCYFQQIKDAAQLHHQINNIAGVAENGLFINIATSAVIAYKDGSIKEINKS